MATASASPSSVGPARLGELLSETVAYCKAHWQSLAVGVVVFGLVLGLVSAYFSDHAGTAMMRGAEQLGIDTDRMQELNKRIEAGDAAALTELESMLSDQFENLSGEQVTQKMMGPFSGYVTTMLPVMGVAALISWLLFFLGNAYYSLVAIEGKDVGGTLERMKVTFIPLVGVTIWSVLRSFVWIPIIGLIPAIILSPRFIAAPLILLAEGKGVMASVSESYARTRGYTGKILGDMIAMFIIVGIPSGIMSTIFDSMSFFGVLSVRFIVVQIVSQVIIAFMTVFAVRLAHTILQHPRA